MGMSDELTIDEVLASLRSQAADQCMGNATFAPVHINAAVRLMTDYATLLAAHKKLCEAVVKSKAAEDYHASQEAYDWLVTAADLAALELEQDDAN